MRWLGRRPDAGRVIPGSGGLRKVGGLRRDTGKAAALLGISVKTLHNWEQGRRKPTGAARVLLRLAARHPEIVLKEAAA
jgi:DNA-binding transcriptional regulator YiaG